jgi:hypothetical protein
MRNKASEGLKALWALQPFLRGYGLHFLFIRHGNCSTDRKHNELTLGKAQRGSESYSGACRTILYVIPLALLAIERFSGVSPQII